MKSSHRQYLASALTAGLLCAWQLWGTVQRFGIGGAHPRADVMQRQVVDHFLASPRLAVALLLFGLLMLATHLLLTAGAVAVYRAATRIVFVGKRDAFWPCMTFLAATILLAMFANRWLFPQSSAFVDAEVLMIQTMSPVLIAGLGIAVGGAAALAIYVWLTSLRRPVLVAAGAGVATLMLGAWSLTMLSSGRDAEDVRPDVIILGIDSLRPDHLSSYGGVPPGLTPAIDAALAESVVLADVRTPLARTFVSYNSLLTGKNPIHHGARFNLYPRTEFSSSDNLVWRLKQSGYTTMMAMDESRFANFDGTFGFDTTIVPQVGAMDFVVGSSFDFLASNLLIAAIPPSRWMSAVQGNRAAYRSYRTDDHPSRVLAALREAPGSQPLFMVSHLCLPHWPYLPSGLEGDRSLDWVRNIPGYEESPRQYLRAIVAADQQFSRILAELRAQGRLQNAILIVMSDHGEDFAFDRDQLARDHEGGAALGSYGHGSFALSEAQNHVVMGIQRYRDGKPVWTPVTLHGPASTIDVAPTIASELGLGSGDYEGVSWLSNLIDGKNFPTERVRFFENGIRSAGVERPDIDEKRVADDMSYLYRVTDDARFEIRPELLPQKLREKQRGAALGRWGVMTDPRSENAEGALDCWTAVDYEKRTIACVDFPAAQAEVARLQADVCRYYASDDGFGERWCRNQGDSSASLAATN